MSLRTALFILVVVLAGTSGEMSVSHGMKQVGPLRQFSAARIAAMLRRAVKQGWIWLGVSLMAVAFFVFLALLSWEAVSFAVPVTASSYAVGALGARFILGEKVTPMRWAGVLLVCIGVALTCLG